MKKIISLLLIGSMALSLAGCGEDPDAKRYTYISNDAGVEDNSYNQALWSGIQTYAAQAGKKCAFFTPANSDNEKDDAYSNIINQAIKAGTKVVTMAGNDMEAVAFKAQKKHTGTDFILFDGEPRSKEGEDATIRKNTCVVTFSQEQEGFLAGYAAVQEGYRSLGFMGGEKNAVTTKYGSGFIQGANQAATELALEQGAVTINYTCVGDDKLSPAHMDVALNWYLDGCEAIFASDKEIALAVIKAAEATDRKVLCADVDQAGTSDTVLTSAVKDYAGAIESLLKKYDSEDEDAFRGGESIVVDASMQGVALNFETSRFQLFTQEQYNAIYDQLAKGSIQVSAEDTTANAGLITVNLV
ncbi:MAG: BMP family ABC transporter substrate-binding protein [Lachnospiraceae bacterium]|nr:BMP family ABC transporter substrate-binding protein [Lachnospiraceae bacterium]